MNYKPIKYHGIQRSTTIFYGMTAYPSNIIAVQQMNKPLLKFIIKNVIE